MIPSNSFTGRFSFPRHTKSLIFIPLLSVLSNSLISSVCSFDIARKISSSSSTILRMAEEEREQTHGSASLRLGILADIQYAPIDDGFSFNGTPRYYRHALDAVRQATNELESLGSIDAMLNLGDTIDGQCVKHDPQACLQRVLSTLTDNYKNGPIYHTYGNHELYNMDRSTLYPQILSQNKKSGEENESAGYYSAMLNKHWKLIVLDSYDISLLQQNKEKRDMAHDILSKNNPNYKLGLENSPEGLEDLNRRFVAFGGGIDKPQLEWLRNNLEEAREKDQYVIIMSHQPVMPKSCPDVCLIWNYQDVLDTLDEYSDTVALYLSGHTHSDGYVRANNGIHYRVIAAILESPPPICTYAILDFVGTNECFELEGFGKCESATYTLDHLRKPCRSKDSDGHVDVDKAQMVDSNTLVSTDPIYNTTMTTSA